MFGSRLKTWMENYIGRPRKKDTNKDKPKRNETGGVIVESSESLACSDTGISFTSQQVLSSSTTDNKEGYSTTTMESEKSGMTHCHTAVSLPSPESAYSTGYSTDGASPGETGPPEYYINIRTGKHYFPSPAPTPTSPPPDAAFLHSVDHRLSISHRPKIDTLPTSSLPPTTQPQPDTFSRTLTKFSNGFPPRLDQNPLSASVPNYFNTLKSPCKKTSPILTPIKLFLKSPRHDKPKIPGGKKPVSGGKPKKWFKQPFQKFGNRRTDSTEDTRNEPKKEIQLEKNFRYLLGQENCASPRQRNRIKTNPWLPTEPMSSQNFQNLSFGFSPSLIRNRSCSNTPLQNRKSSDPGQTRIKQINGRAEDFLGKLEIIGNRGKLPVELSDHSEEDLTLNEVMGTYNESYVYEKETDILSDSDPTDCEDYDTDSEAENGGDERDSHDDELDFIDNGSVYECEEDFPKNTGRCTYHEVHIKKNSFMHKSDRRKLRKDSDSRKNPRREKRRTTRRSVKQDEEERKRIFEEKVKAKMEENIGSTSLSRVLAQRLLARNASKSAEGTPVTGRRQKLTNELRETHIGSDKGGKKIVGDVVLIDFETDHKYNELMKEAENMFESLRNSPVILNRKEILGRSERSSLDFQKKPCPHKGGSKEPGTPARKSPKELDLKLSVETPKKLKRLDFEKNSFKTRSSAHSPLDPLGPNLRNFAVFSPAPRKVSTSSSEDSEPRKAPGKKVPAGPSGCWGGVPTSPVVPIAFQSVDLGKPLAPYCPQSEPVKRKIYSCSKTYDKLVKRFESPPVFEETKPGKPGHGFIGIREGSDLTVFRDVETCLDGNQGPLQRERRRDGEKIPPRGGILRRTPFPPGRSSVLEKPLRQSLDPDIFR